MRIVLKTPTELKSKNKIIAEKQAEGYTLINISEGFESMISNEKGEFTTPQIILEFQKI